MLRNHTLFETLSQKKEAMLQQLIGWAEINSSSENSKGLAQMFAVLEKDFAILGAKSTRIPSLPQERMNNRGDLYKVPLGDTLLFTKRPHAPVQIIFGGHMDTVFAADSPFQRCRFEGENVLTGPGVADMKGGLLILLHALALFEQSPDAEKIGWRLYINADEEIGSTGSFPLLTELSKGANLALIFEPSFPDGALVSSRKGSLNATVYARGKSAHAGREFHLGRNAITALARFAVEAERLSDPERGITVNVGFIEGGGPVNIVPEQAILKLNARVGHSEDLERVNQELLDLAKRFKKEEIHVTLHVETLRPPKTMDETTKQLFHLLSQCGEELHQPIHWRETGGVCDGNIFASHGVPVIDTLGAIGGGLHTQQEYILLDSLIQRTQLTLLLLMKLAQGELTL